MFQESVGRDEPDAGGRHGTQNRDPRFDLNFPRPCDHKFSITAIAVIEFFTPEKC